MSEEKPKVCRNTNQLNYLFTLGFILAIVLFIVVLVLISRFVLSDESSISEHVKLTKDLIEDVNKVNLELNNKSTLEENSVGINFRSVFKVDSSEISDFSYYNLNENKSIFTIFIDREVFLFENKYYIKYKNSNEILKNDLVLYTDKLTKEIKLSHFVSFDDVKNDLVLYDFQSEKLIKVSFIEVLGKVIYLQ